jgi:alkylhydroperoxidase/carboxymuconolactone decarboxylase family protein YurZ
MPVTDESLERWATGDDISNAHHAPMLQSPWWPKMSEQMNLPIRNSFRGEGSVLSARERGLVNLALLSSLGRTSSLRSRCHGLLRAGFTEEELAEVFRQTATYIGMPAATQCSQILAEAVQDLKEAGVVVPAWEDDAS